MKLIIIGGGAGGAAAAARARRLDENAQIVLVERGEYVSFASCGLPYYAGGAIKERAKLIVYPVEALRKRFAIDVRLRSRAVSLHPSEKRVAVEDLATGAKYSEHYDSLILAPGAEPLIPSIAGADLPMVCTVRTIPDIDRIKSGLDAAEGGSVAVVGGGYIGLEMAENIRARGMAVDLIEMQGQVLPTLDPEMAAPLHRHLAENGVVLHLGRAVTAIERVSGGDCVVRTREGDAFPARMVVISAGVKAELALAKDAGLRLGRAGVTVDRRMRTSDPSIFAVGDAVETGDPVTGVSRPVALAGPAARQARVAVNAIFDLPDEYRGTIGTAIVKVFSMAAGMTGATERGLKAAGKPYAKVYLHCPDHAAYYPGAAFLTIKLLYAPGSGEALGAQVVGRSGVDKRTDVFATAIRHSLTVKDLAELELAYAPPYGATRDPVNMAGLAALNGLQGTVEYTHWDELAEDEFLLDVRPPPEFEKGAVPGALHLPLNDLRDRLAEIPCGRPLAVYCRSGYRSYIACRMLSQKGFKARNISGGYEMYGNFRDAGMLRAGGERERRKRNVESAQKPH